jgi:hypothetical protein
MFSHPQGEEMKSLPCVPCAVSKNIVYDGQKRES